MAYEYEWNFCELLDLRNFKVFRSGGWRHSCRKQEDNKRREWPEISLYKELQKFLHKEHSFLFLQTLLRNPQHTSSVRESTISPPAESVTVMLIYPAETDLFLSIRNKWGDQTNALLFALLWFPLNTLLTKTFFFLFFVDPKLHLSCRDKSLETHLTAVFDQSTHT